MPDAQMAADLRVVAVGLAKALKLPKDDPRRTKYLALLAEAGLSATEDAATEQIIVSLNLRQFVQHLVDLQRAQAAVLKAA